MVPKHSGIRQGTAVENAAFKPPDDVLKTNGQKRMMKYSVVYQKMFIAKLCTDDTSVIYGNNFEDLCTTSNTVE
jgi:hypothetical protein